jgi:hypothetical protein
MHLSPSPMNQNLGQPNGFRANFSWRIKSAVSFNEGRVYIPINKVGAQHCIRKHAACYVISANWHRRQTMRCKIVPRVIRRGGVLCIVCVCHLYLPHHSHSRACQCVYICAIAIRSHGWPVCRCNCSSFSPTFSLE